MSSPDELISLARQLAQLTNEVGILNDVHAIRNSNMPMATISINASTMKSWTFFK